MNWTKERLQAASLVPTEGTYEAHPKDLFGLKLKEKHPHIFNFEAISFGDGDGQAFFVPLDESSKETAEFILLLVDLNFIL